MVGPGFRAPQVGSSPPRSASSPSSNSRSAIDPRRRRNESIWASICFWIVRASTEVGTLETASCTGCRYALMLRRRQSRCWRCRTSQRSELTQRSLVWLKKEADSVDSVSSLAWCILSLFVYQESVEALKNRLATIMGDGRDIRNNATLATALLALKCGEMIHPFVVLR